FDPATSGSVQEVPDAARARAQTGSETSAYNAGVSASTAHLQRSSDLSFLPTSGLTGVQNKQGSGLLVINAFLPCFYFIVVPLSPLRRSPPSIHFGLPFC